MTNILFICKYNRFRSRVAEKYFNRINKNKNIHVKSAGIIKGEALLPVTIRISKKYGFDLRGKPQGLSSKLLSWQDIIIIVADDVPSAIFNGKYKKKVIVWKIEDICHDNKKGIERVIKKIIGKVNKLNRFLRNRKWKL